MQIIPRAAGQPSAATVLPAPKTIAPTGRSFEKQLISALEKYLEESGETVGQVEVETRPQAGQESGARQFVVTVRAPEELPTASAPAIAPPARAVSSGFLERIAAANYEQWERATGATPRRTTLDAYWEAQPPEVQVLKNMRWEGDRTVVARELADLGFLIDVPIMVQGQDPLTIMIARQNAGYTWVPSANMEPVRVVPGINMPGMASYDPGNPPPGAIQVSTDFANGIAWEQPWLLDVMTT